MLLKKIQILVMRFKISNNFKISADGLVIWKNTGTFSPALTNNLRMHAMGVDSKEKLLVVVSSGRYVSKVAKK